MKQSLIELFGSVSRLIVVSFGLVGTLNLAGAAQALDIPTCAAGEYLWLVTAGNPSGTLMPNADMRVETVTFQDWSDGTKTLRTAQFTNVPKGTLGEAKTFERYSGGGNLGWFAQSWPVPIEGYAIEDFTALPPSNPAPSAAGGEYPSDFTSSRLIDGASGQTLAQIVSSPSFDGRLTYVAPSDARINFVTIALCTTALPVVKAPTQTQTPTPTPTSPQTTTPTPTPKIKPTKEAIDPAAPNAELDIIQAITAAAQSVKDAAAKSKAAQQSAAAAAKTTGAAAESDRAAANKAADLAAKALKAAKEASANAAAAITVTAAQDAAREAAKQAGIAADQAAIASLAAENAADIEDTTPPAVITPPNAETIEARNAAKTQWLADRDTAAAEAVTFLALREEEGQAAILAKIKARETFEATKKAHVKRDMITSGAIAASAVLNVVGNALAGMVRGGAATAPTPAPSPIPAPAPTPTPTPAPTQAGGGGTGRGRTKGEKGKKNDSVQGKLTQSQRGVLFPSSTSFTGDIPDAFAAAKAAYAAVGRVGYPYDPDNLDWEDAFGSAVLIAPDKVLTNYHIYYYYLEGMGDPDLGIEFEAIEGETQSEFIPFKNLTPIILPEMDAVIMTLSTSSSRTPIWPSPEPTNDLLGRDVIAIGYTLEPKNDVEEEELEAVFGTNPTWGVKRWTPGHVILHDDDDNSDIVFEVPAGLLKDTGRGPVWQRVMVQSLCHSASSAGGNSGGALIDAQTGAFLGLHFGGKSSANYAVPAKELLRGLQPLPIEPPNSGTIITPLVEDPPAIPDAPILPDPVIEDPVIEEPVFEEPVLDEPVVQNLDPVNAPDDLTRIEGIGPKTAAALHAGGVRTFKAIAQRSPYDLLPILAAGGLKRRDPTTWPAQAALAAIGDWETLEAWQDLLHGGREPKQDS